MIFQVKADDLPSISTVMTSLKAEQEPAWKFLTVILLGFC